MRPFRRDWLAFPEFEMTMPKVDVIDRAEISRGSFSRMVSLPADVDKSKAKAALEDGVLELTLPKIEKAKRRTTKVD